MKKTAANQLLVEAIITGNAADVRRAIAAGASPDLAPNGVPVLSVAVIRRDLGCVRALLDGGANPNQQDYAGESPLGHFAMTVSGDEHGAILETLVSSGADVNAQSELGASPIDLATVYLNRVAAVQLFKHGARYQRKESYSVLGAASHSRG